MKEALRPRYTFEEYLDIESRRSAVKHEYVAGEVFAMAGGSVEHSALSTSLCGLLVGHLRGGPCRPHGPDLRIHIESVDVVTYADVSVVCDPMQPAPDSPTHVIDPRVVVEVLSPSTERYDREQKRLYYQQIESLQKYVLVAQDRRRVGVWRRGTQRWSHALADAGSGFELPSIDFSLSVDELYDAAGV